MRQLLLVFLLFLLAFQPAAAQQEKQDSISRKGRNPRTATLLSAILPGAGQVYNKKYWKVPVLYGGGAALAYYIRLNNQQYELYRDSYRQVRAGENDNFNGAYDAEQLARLREYWRRNRDLLVIVSGLTYLLNIADAAVDAHLSQFDVSDNLSMRIEPGLLPLGRNQLAAVVGLRFDIH